MLLVEIFLYYINNSEDVVVTAIAYYDDICMFDIYVDCAISTFLSVPRLSLIWAYLYL